MPLQDTTQVHHDVFVGDSESARLLRAHDWTTSGLGDPSGWPETLKVALRLMLTSRFEMWVGWGPDVVFFYNDAYRPTLGIKHPAAMARPTREVWPEIWDDIEQRVRLVYDHGQSTWDRALPLVLERSGRPEETYHTFSYSPLILGPGRVGGLFCTVTEETDRVISERRLASLRKLAAGLVGTDSREAVLRATHRCLREATDDLPFSLLYLFDDQGHAQLQCATGLPADHALAPPAVAPDASGIWPLARVLASATSFTLELGRRTDMPPGRWGRPSSTALMVPLGAKGSDRPLGFLVAGLSAVFDLSDDYRSFVDLLAGQVTASLVNADAFERTRAARDRVWRNSRDLLVMVSAEGIFEAVNPAWTDILGHRQEDVVGRSFLDFVWPEDTVLASDGLATAVSKDLTDYENRYRHIDGGYRWISWHTRAEPGMVFAYGRDVTAHKESQAELAAAQEELRQSQKMEAVGQLTGGIAHDFNNLLAGISGSLELLQRRVDLGNFTGMERYITIAQGASRRAAALTQRLLAFARRQTLDPQATDVNRLVSGMEELIRRAVGPDVTLEVVGSGGLWPTLIDRSQLENALLNLCINARDAMSPAGGRLTIETSNKWLDSRGARERELTPGQYVALCVTDTGSGMTPEVVARAFEPFYTTKPLGQGTGLGLSMVYGFARQSGGQVRIYSELDKGTTICLYLPRHTGVAAEEPTDPQLPEAGSDGETVLVIDDEESVRTLIVEVLQEAGYRTLDADTGPAGLAILRSAARIDLLITDVGLPGGMNGRQVADAARVSRGDLRVLFITGYAENAAVGNGHLEAGMAVLTKPFAMAELLTSANGLLGR
ncbi:response regulator [Xylophilus sp. Kf1]|nr:response regulator [Xylophilus sp. Kf1]